MLYLAIWLAFHVSLATAEELLEVRQAYQQAWSAPWDQLPELFRSRYPAVRYWALKAVRYRPSPPKAVLEAARQRCADDDPVVAVTAAAALAFHGQSTAAIVQEAFRRALQHPQPGVRLEALTCLRELPELAPVFRVEYERTLQLGRQMPSEVQKLCRELLELSNEDAH